MTTLKPTLLLRIAAFLATSAMLPASTLFVGFNTATPVQLYSTSGSYMNDFGPAGAIAGFSDGVASYFAVTPSMTNGTSSVGEYNANWSQTGSFTLNNLITDAGMLGGNLLFSGFDGTVYRTSASGSILDSWNTGFQHIGVTSNGTDIFTTEGDGGNLIDIWSPTGTSLGQIATPYSGLYGLGYDASTGDFWAGSSNYVYQLSGTGSLIATFDLSGDSRTPNGALHDSLEVGNLLNPTPPPSTAPEPASIFMILLGGVLLAGFAKSAKLRKYALQLLIPAGALVGSCFGSVTVSFTSSPSSSAQVGTPVTWTAKASDSANSGATFLYQYSVARSGSALQVMKDWSESNTFPWAPSDSEGTFQVQVLVRSSTGATGTASELFSVTSRVTGTTPVISRTNNALVALYSMPPCASGRTARVRFKAPSDSVWQATPTKSCNGSTSLNFYIAGMRGSSTYQLQQDVFYGPFNTPGPLMTFTTGATPAGVVSTPYSVVKAPTAPNNTAYPFTLTGATGAFPYAFDSQGQIVWYQPKQPFTVYYFTHMVPGGFIFEYTSGYTSATGTMLREYDLVGNVVRETNSEAISARLVSMGDDPVTSLHHEVVVLPNGWLAFFGSTEKVADQGKGPVAVLGDQVIVVDSNFNVKWYWNEFKHLDIKRPAILGETCHTGQAGCPTMTIPGYTVANDWTHSNSIYPSPDGNLVVSVRHQDWIIKIRYQNGTGDGAILWRFGNDGDFTTSASDPFPWPSHQHDVQYTPSGLLTLFDNGNTRVSMFGGNSRGQAWSLNESTHVATRVTNLDLGVFSQATGSTQLLSNGNYFFDLGFIKAAATQLKEYNSANVLQQQVDYTATSYRSFRLRDFYTGY